MEVGDRPGSTPQTQSRVEPGTMTDENKSLLTWISPHDQGPEQDRFFSRYRDGEFHDFLNSPDFQAWIKTEGQTLFCSGLLGVGKTVLTSAIIDRLSKSLDGPQKVGLAYFYCDHRLQAEQGAFDIGANILKQLLERCASIPNDLTELHRRTPLSGPTALGESCFEEHIPSVCTNYDRVFVLIDGLDECEPSERDELLSLLSCLPKQSRINIFATSRHFHGIKRQMKNAVSLEVRGTVKGTERFLSGKVGQLHHLVQQNDSLQELICKEISEAVDGK
jgi:Cdc6-like AAA superfamily ATPase